MTEVSEAALAKALELIGRACGPHEGIYDDALVMAQPNSRALARFIQEVNDACEVVKREYGFDSALEPFILPDPADPLEEAQGAVAAELGSVFASQIANLPEYQRRMAATLRTELAKRGLKIVASKS